MRRIGSLRTIELKVSSSDAGDRLDVWLSRALVDLSRSYIQNLIHSSRVTMAGRAAKASYRVREGDVVTLELPPPSPPVAVAEPIPLDIVYEDRYILLINKPAGVIVHPGAGNPRGTIANALVNYCGELASVGDGLRPGIVHRLDKGTSGLLLVAKDDVTLRKLGKLFSLRQVVKTYWAIVWGEPVEKSWLVDVPIGRNRTHRQRMAATPRGGKEAQTSFRLIWGAQLCSVVEAVPYTGRTHQVRVHLAYSGHPVLGDSQYGGRKNRVRTLSVPARRKAEEVLAAMNRPALHALRLEFDHPMTGEHMEFETRVPDDFKTVFGLLGFGYERRLS